MESIDERVAAFFTDHNFDVVERIGFGIHGQVFSVIEGDDFLITVVKFFEDVAPFFRELKVYRRLAEESITELAGCRVPRLIECDDEHFTIQMSLVTRPFCLDFAAAYLDGLPDYFPPLDAECPSESSSVTKTGAKFSTCSPNWKHSAFTRPIPHRRIFRCER